MERKKSLITNSHFPPVLKSVARGEGCGRALTLPQSLNTPIFLGLIFSLNSYQNFKVRTTLPKYLHWFWNHDGVMLQDLDGVGPILFSNHWNRRIVEYIENWKQKDSTVKQKTNNVIKKFKNMSRFKKKCFCEGGCFMWKKTY